MSSRGKCSIKTEMFSAEPLFLCNKIGRISNILTQIKRKNMTFCPDPFLDINIGLVELFRGSCFLLLPKVDFDTGILSRQPVYRTSIRVLKKL